jgi:hypothetical protein
MAANAEVSDPYRQALQPNTIINSNGTLCQYFHIVLIVMGMGNFSMFALSTIVLLYKFMN